AVRTRRAEAHIAVVREAERLLQRCSNLLAGRTVGVDAVQAERNEVFVVEVRVLRVEEAVAGGGAPRRAVAAQHDLVGMALSGQERGRRLTTRRHQPRNLQSQWTRADVVDLAGETQTARSASRRGLVDVAGVAGRRIDRDGEPERRAGNRRYAVD